MPGLCYNVFRQSEVVAMDKQRILVVDDEKEITDLVEIYLQNAGYEVAKFYDGRSALDYLAKERVDLAVLDIMLPDIDGFSLCEEIRKEHYFPIIMLTAKIEEADKIRGILLGADDYMTKPFLPMELLARIKGQLRRAGAYNQALGHGQNREIYHIHGLELDGDKHVCRLYEKEVDLTATEFAILLYLCRHMNQVVTAEEIFEQVWKEKYLDNNNTVFVHVARIREKLGENARKPKFIKTVWGVGYKMEIEEGYHV